MLLLIDSYQKGRIVCTECCRKVRRGSRENGDRFSITKASKAGHSNEGRPETRFLGKPFWILI